MEDVEKKIKSIKIEDKIWIIYIGIIILSYYANFLEEDYFKHNNNESRKKYQNVMIIIFSILVIVYYYFFKSSYDDYKNLKPWDSSNKKTLTTLSFIASFLILISGLIFLYIAIKDDSIQVELAFN